MNLHAIITAAMSATNASVPAVNSRVQQRLLEICRTSAASLEFEPLMTVLIDAASELTGSEWSMILVPAEGSGRLNVMAAPFYKKESLRSAEISLDNSLAGESVTTARAVTFCAAQQKGAVRSNTWELLQQATSAIAMPIFYQQQIVGVLECFNKFGGKAYSGQDTEVLEVLAAQAASSLANHALTEKNEQAIQKMMELDRMKSDFISIASHELRTPLGLIIGHISFIKETATEAQMEDVDVISKSAARMKDLIDDFGDMDAITSGVRTLKRSRVLFDALIPQVVGAFQNLALEGRVRLVYELKGSNLAVEGDEDKLELVLRNLIKNGVNFTNPGGVVKVMAEEVPGFIKIAVVDNGIGIPAVELKKIFNRFYQVENHLTRKHGGMGIGLSSAKEMAELHGGRITVESVEGKGSRFTVLVPLNAAQASAAQKVFLE
jgi:signal transduction histidine kinase